MSTKLFVGGLPWAMDNQRLKEVFAAFGDVADARVILDRETGRSRGFGFVTYSDEAGATKALELDGQEVDGRTIRVDRAQEKERPARGRPGGDGGGGRPGGGGAPPGGGGARDAGGPRREFKDDWGGGGGDRDRAKGKGKGRGRRRGGRGGRGGGGGEGPPGGFGEFDEW